MAKLLQQAGVEATVYERDKDPQARIWGGTLDLHEGSGKEALKRAGLLERYFALAKPMGRIMADENGKVLHTVPPALDKPEINRNNLRTLLLDSLTAGTVVWDRKFMRLDKHEDQWLLHFDKAPDAIADSVIGANGGLSTARNYVSDAGVQDTGTLIIQGEVAAPETACPAFFELCNNNILMTANQGYPIGMSAIGN